MRSSDTAVTISEIMTRNVITVGPDTPVAEVARILERERISGLPVTANGDEPVGIVSELDVISRTGETAADIMSSGVISVTEDTPAEDVVEILRSRRVRRLPVVREGKLIGIVSRSDLVRLFALTRWACEECGYFVRGFGKPERCTQCGSTEITLQREPPGM